MALIRAVGGEGLVMLKARRISQGSARRVKKADLARLREAGQREAGLLQELQLQCRENPVVKSQGSFETGGIHYIVLEKGALVGIWCPMSCHGAS